MAEPLKGTHKVTVFLSVSCQRRTLPCCSALNSLFIPNPNDVLNHAGVSSPLTGTKSRSGANSLQTVGLPHHLLHLLFQLLLLLLQATWRFELSSALLTSNLFSPVGSIGRYDAVCAQSVNNRTTQSYTAKLLQKNHITWTDRKMETKNTTQNIFQRTRTRVTQGVIRRIALNHCLLFSTHPFLCKCHPMFDPCFTLTSNHESVFPGNQPPGDQKAVWVHPVFLQSSRHCWTATREWNYRVKICNKFGRVCFFFL